MRKEMHSPQTRLSIPIEQRGPSPSFLDLLLEQLRVLVLLEAKFHVVGLPLLLQLLEMVNLPLLLVHDHLVNETLLLEQPLCRLIAP